LRSAGNDYWATQVNILVGEVAAWSKQAEGEPDDAVTLMRTSADQEDAIEKLPVTPGPILPAREQLGYLLLEQKKASLANDEFAIALANAPGRHSAVQGKAAAARLAPTK